MNKKQEEIIEKLHNVKQEYMNTTGIDTIQKKGPAKDKFNQLANASGECWKEIQSQTGTSQEKREFMEKFKKEIS